MATLRPARVKQSPEDYLRNLTRDGNRVASDEEVKKLLSLTYPTGGSIINLEESYTFFEIIGFLMADPKRYSGGRTPTQVTISFLETVKNKEEAVWASPTLEEARKKSEINADILRSRERGTTGVGKCPKCGGTELLFSEKQTRSADEPVTIFARCINCGNGWRE
jgi:DNA-directed RNA polymerase subunit M/transcription elongation factor TFIIS